MNFLLTIYTLLCVAAVIVICGEIVVGLLKLLFTLFTPTSYSTKEWVMLLIPYGLIACLLLIAYPMWWEIDPNNLRDKAIMFDGLVTVLFVLTIWLSGNSVRISPP